MPLTSKLAELNMTKAYAYDCLINQKYWTEQLTNAENKIVQLSHEVNDLKTTTPIATESVVVEEVGSEAEDDIQP